MSIIILASIEDFKKKTNWPLYYYAEKLQNMGYPNGYIEFFLRKLQQRIKPGEDPDLILNQIIQESNFEQPIDPYQYPGGNPEDIAGLWAKYYKERPEMAKQKYPKGINFNELSLEDIINQSREWGSIHYPVIDRLSDGFSMVKLTTEDAMMNCGDELGVCIGLSGYGETLRKNALRGEGEIWALIDPNGNTVAMADTRIDQYTGKRYIQQIRAYKNRGFRYKGYGDLIDEWLSLHPEFDTQTEYDSKLKHGNAEWYQRGEWGDDDPEDWEPDYIQYDNDDYDDDDDDDFIDLEEIVRSDIYELANYIYDLDIDFLKSLYNEIIDNNEKLDEMTIIRYFDIIPELFNKVLEEPAENFKNYASFVETMENGNIDFTTSVINNFNSNYIDSDQIIQILELYKNKNPEFYLQLKNIGQSRFNDFLNTIEESFFNQTELTSNIEMAACYDKDNPEEAKFVSDNIYNKLIGIINQIDPKNIQNIEQEKEISQKILEIQFIFNEYNKYIPDKKQKALNLFSLIVDLLPSNYERIKHSNLLIYNGNLSDDNTPKFIKSKIIELNDIEKIIFWMKINNSILRYNSIDDVTKNPTDEQKIDYTNNIFVFLQKIKELKNQELYNGDKDEEIVDLMRQFFISDNSDDIAIMHQKIMSIYPDLLLQPKYISKFLENKFIPDKKEKYQYYSNIKIILNSIVDFYKQNNIDPKYIFDQLDPSLKPILYFAGIIPEPKQGDNFSIRDFMTNPFEKPVEANVKSKIYRIANQIDTYACDIADEIEKILMFN